MADAATSIPNRPQNKSPEDSSGFRIYSIGRAAENKPLSSHELEIMPIEKLGYSDGEINETHTTQTAKGVDADGNTYETKVSSSNAIKATWLPIGSNRSTAPDVRRGERVLIWQYGTVDQYYWTAMGLDDTLRRLETVVYVFSGTKDESVKKLTPDNSYYIEVSTHTKQVTLSTSKANGEPFGYIMQLNTDQGVFTLTDDEGNYIQLDSKERVIKAANTDQCSLELNKRNLSINVPDTFTLDAKEIKTNATIANYTVKTHIHTGTTMTVNAKSTFNQVMKYTAGISGAGTCTHNGVNIGSTHTHTDSRNGTTSPPK